MTASVTSTYSDATLSITDPSSVATGHLVNGTFSLPESLQARARNATNTGTTYANVGSSASPLTLLTWNGPVSNNLVTLNAWATPLVYVIPVGAILFAAYMAHVRMSPELRSKLSFELRFKPKSITFWAGRGMRAT